MENGKAAVVPSSSTDLGFGSTEFHVLRPNGMTNPRFIWHYVRQQAFRHIAEEHMTGSVGQLRVPADFLKTFSLELPPEAVQNEIVEVLDSGTTSAQSATRHLGQAQRSINRFRQAALAAACSGRLTADWRKERYGFHGDDLEGDIPLHWQKVVLGELSLSIRGGSNEVPTNEPTDFPILRSSSVRPFAIDYSDIRYLAATQSHRRDNFLQNGDLLITRLSGSIEYVGNCAVVDSLEGRRIQYPDRLFCCRLRDPSEAKYVEMYFAGPAIRKQIEDASRSAAGHQRISISDLKSFSILRPPFDEQIEIVRRVDELLSLADSVTNRIRTAMGRVDLSSQALLAKAFRGELGSAGVAPEASFARFSGDAD